VLSLAGKQILTAPSAFAHACPGEDKNVVVLDDPSDPLQIFDVNNDLICAFHKDYRDDHVHKA
jgi:hypothetical protein